MNVILQILQAGNLIGVLAPLGIELALKIKSLLTLDPNIQVNIVNLAGEAVTADDATTQLIADWKTANNLPA